jgi:hypothetical protein
MMIKELRGNPQAAAPTEHMVIVLNWTEELKQRVPTK